MSIMRSYAIKLDSFYEAISKSLVGTMAIRTLQPFAARPRDYYYR